MTSQTSFHPLLRWVMGFFQIQPAIPAAPAAPATPATPAEVAQEPEETGFARVFSMDRLLQIEAVRPGTRESVKLFTQQMSTTGLLFKTGQRLHEGEALRLKLLLQADVCFEVVARVLWVHFGPQGCSGQLDLEVTPPQQREILHFLQLREQI